MDAPDAPAPLGADAPAPSPDTLDLARAVLGARAGVAAAHDAEKVWKSALDDAEAALIDALLRHGARGVNLNGHYLHLSAKVWARPKNGTADGDAIDWLRSVGWGDVAATRINSQSLGSLVRERRDQELPLPDGAEKHLIITETPGLSVRKS